MLSSLSRRPSLRSSSRSLARTRLQPRDRTLPTADRDPGDQSSMLLTSTQTVQLPTSSTPRTSTGTSTTSRDSSNSSNKQDNSSRTNSLLKILNNLLPNRTLNSLLRTNNLLPNKTLNSLFRTNNLPRTLNNLLPSRTLSLLLNSSSNKFLFQSLPESRLLYKDSPEMMTRMVKLILFPLIFSLSNNSGLFLSSNNNLFLSSNNSLFPSNSSLLPLPSNLSSLSNFSSNSSSHS